MSEVPVQLVVAAFQTADGADLALKELKQAKKEHLIKIDNAAVIHKDAKGKVSFKETNDMGGGRGSVIGGVIGGALGILTGGATLAIAGAGALIGGLAAKMRDSGFKDDRLQQIGESLTPGTSAIVAVIEHEWVAELEREMQEAGAQVLTEAISADIAQQLGEGNEVAFSALSTEDALVTDRIATGEDTTDVSETIVTAEGVEAMHAVVTEEGVAAEHAVVTEDGAAYEAVAATEDKAAYVGIAADSAGNVAAVAAEVEAVDVSDGESAGEIVDADATAADDETKPADASS